MWGILERFAIRFLKWRRLLKADSYPPMYLIARDLKIIRTLLDTQLAVNRVYLQKIYEELISYGDEDDEKSELRVSRVSGNPPKGMVI